MAVHYDSPDRMSTQPALDTDFSSKLESALSTADLGRRRRVLRARLTSSASVLLLVGPLLAWKLIGTTPGGEHIVVDSLVWLTFLLDIGVHVDSATLSYLHLQFLPVVVGLLVLVLAGTWLLWREEPSME